MVWHGESLEAVKDNDEITEAQIPEGATCLPSSAFSSCNALELIVIPDTVAEINSNALPRKQEKLVVGCVSYARTWAVSNGYPLETEAQAGTCRYAVIHSGEAVADGALAPTETEPGHTAALRCDACNDLLSEPAVIPALQELHVLRLPGHLAAISDEAFADAAMQAVIIPEGCQRIGSRAFADCKSLLYVRIPDTVTDMAEDAFTGCPDSILIDMEE